MFREAEGPSGAWTAKKIVVTACVISNGKYAQIETEDNSQLNIAELETLAGLSVQQCVKSCNLSQCPVQLTFRCLAKTPKTTLFPQFMPAELITPVAPISLHPIRPTFTSARPPHHNTFDLPTSPALSRTGLALLYPQSHATLRPPDSLGPPLPSSHTSKQVLPIICRILFKNYGRHAFGFGIWL